MFKIDPYNLDSSVTNLAKRTVEISLDSVNGFSENYTRIERKITIGHGKMQIVFLSKISMELITKRHVTKIVRNVNSKQR